MPTLMDYFGVPFDHEIHGESLKDVWKSNAEVNRDAVLYGWFGMPVNVTDGRYTYMRSAATEANSPLYMHYQIPTTYHYHNLPGPRMFADAQFGQFLPYTDMPVVRARATMPRSPIVENTQLFDIENDPGQLENLTGFMIEDQYRDLLTTTMMKIDAPPSQFERLGLK